jgi:hypothetical protein
MLPEIDLSGFTSFIPRIIEIDVELVSLGRFARAATVAP